MIDTSDEFHELDFVEHELEAHQGRRDSYDNEPQPNQSSERPRQIMNENDERGQNRSAADERQTK